MQNGVESIMKIKDFLRFNLLLTVVAALGSAQQLAPFRPPAVPLVVHDPYFSIWSFADHLTDENTKHWTGKPNTLTAFARIDGKTYRVIGSDPKNIAALTQTRLDVLPTQTVYEFSGAGVALKLTFLTPALPEDLDALSRPLTYVEWTVSSTDSARHQVSLYFDAAANLAVNTPQEAVVWSRLQLDGGAALKMGSQQQPVLGKVGDDLRIDWGYLYLAGDRSEGLSLAAADRSETRHAFESEGKLPNSDSFAEDRPGYHQSVPVIACSLDLGSVGSNPVSRYMMLAYDDIYSIEYFERKERAWWRRNGADAADLLRTGREQHDSLQQRSQAFDQQLMADLRSVGGEQYARLASLAYRQTLGAQKLVVDTDGSALFFPKENFSNGCIGTVDVIYPSSPFELLFSPTLMKAELRPVLDYASMPRWHFPFAPHDLGTYPKANGQVYGGGEKTEENQMPVEESGDMLLMMAALAHVEGNAQFSEKYWPVLSKWALYLKEKGLDPENQLSTDDFAGHLAHNANLSIKAILALGSYGMLCDMTGRKKEGAQYRELAQGFAHKWMQLAKDGGHYRLAFDKPGTWSQKYNLVWDRILGLNLFPPEVAHEELAYYRTKLNTFGLPLDNRRDYTKLDWELWTATLAPNKAEFEALVAPAYRFATESSSRVPLTDWYSTETGKQEGFQARSVVGGLFIKMLADDSMWKKWASRPQLAK
jgi:hypothetical protein